MKLIKLILSLLILLTLASCSSGGDGGGDGESNEDGSQVRTREPGLRIIHGSIDGSPLTAKINGIDIQTSRYVEPQFFTSILEGVDVSIAVDRARSVGVSLTNITTDIVGGNEYTIFVYGSVMNDTERARLIVEPVVEPEDGFARVRIMNALEGSGGVVLESAGGLIEEAEMVGDATDFVEIPAGPRTFFVRTDLGSPLGSVEIDLENRSELSVLVTGSLELGVVFVKTFVDFD